MGRTPLATRAARRAPSEAIADRNEAIALMNPSLQRKVKEIAKVISDTRTDNLRFYHRLGKTCLDIANAPDKYNVGADGQPVDAMALLQRALSTQTRSLKDARRFVELCDDDNFAALLALENVDADFRLHWGHVRYLLILNTATLLLTWGARAVAKLWDPMELHRQIKKRFGVKTGHGRGHAVPKSAAAALRQIANVTDTWLNKQEKVWRSAEHDIFAAVLDQASDSHDRDELDLLTELKTKMERLSAEAQTNEAELSRVIEQVTAMVEEEEARREKEQAEQAGSERSRSIDLGTKGKGRKKTLASA